MKKNCNERSIFYAAILLAVTASLLAFPALSTAFESSCVEVNAGTCIGCHPGDNPGKCNLIALNNHTNHGCLLCHADCVDGTPPPTFDHMDDCLECHKLDKLHKKHDENGYANCGNCHTKKRVLIAYDSKQGSTAVYMDKVGEVLCENGYQVDRDQTKNLVETNVSSYDGVILGSPVYIGEPLPGIKKFLDTHRTELAGMPVAYVANGLFGGQSGNAHPAVFWYFSYFTLLIHYPDVFDLSPYLPCPGFPFCSTPPPYWVGLMPGKYIPRYHYPVDYIVMELTGQGGLKDYSRIEAASEYAQVLSDYGFFECPGNIAPTVTATAMPTSGPEPLTVLFEAAADDVDGSVVSYEWTFDDGTSSNENPVSHEFKCDKVYNVVVQVLDDCGAVGQDTIEVDVQNAGAPLTFDCDIMPIFFYNCYDCHGNAGGLSLRSCEGLQAGGDSGPAVVPGDKEASYLYQKTVEGHPGDTPEGEPLLPSEIDTIGAWIDSLDPADPDFCD